MSALQRQLRRRVGQITLKEIHEHAVVTRALPAQVSLKRRAAGAAYDLAIPSYAPGNLFRSLRGTKRSSTQAVNEIFICLQGPGLKPHIQRRVERTKNAVDSATR